VQTTSSSLPVIQSVSSLANINDIATERIPLQPISLAQLPQATQTLVQATQQPTQIQVKQIGLKAHSHYAVFFLKKVMSWKMETFLLKSKFV